MRDCRFIGVPAVVQPGTGPLRGRRVLFTVSIAASPRVASRKGPEGVIALKGVGVILHAVFFNRFASRSSYLLKLVSPAQ